MDSYPNELLAHPQPLMFVAGLTTASQSSRARSLSTVSNVSGSGFGSGSGMRSRRESSTANTLLSGSSMSGGSGLVSSRQGQETEPAGQEVLVSSPPPGSKDGGEADQTAEPERDDASGSASASDAVFETLVKDLRNALGDKSGKGKVWLPESERKTFRIMLVDKAVRLPTRKVNSTVPSSSPNPEASTPHSPLSPLTPSSPCFPDGLIAPVWIRKHAELVPSVFVLFLRLYESPERAASAAPETGEEVAAREAKEKEMDDGLVREIGERRRRLGERGIKLTVVLMASAATLDSPALDPRLSYLRRASALSSKASLFVLTPVPAEELPEFVQSLQDALYESAIEYYSQHGKRVRRKRSRLPNTASVSVQPGHAGKNLGPGGWAVRYEFKAAWLAEIRGDFDLARRHYEDCWNELARMFASTQTLPPRTKRWAEAKVLADCVAIRICRLLLYGDEAARVLNPFFIHLKRFGELSRGWGIGEDTFEFWSWIARQYRILAELLELGIQSGAQISTIPNPVFPTAAAAATVPSPDYFSTPISSLNPLHILQPPAYYYYTAAVCSIQRRQRYEEALAVEKDALSSEAGAASGYVSTSPGFASEKKVDHSALIVELLNKAYGLLKGPDADRHEPNRLALFVAYRIAETYSRCQQYDLALKFFDQISTSYRRDQWSPIVREIRTLWYDCAKRTGSVDTAARLLWESLATDSGIAEEERPTTQDDLLTLLKTTSPASSNPILLDQTASDSLIEVRVGFWEAESQVDTLVPFQVVLSCPDDVHIDKIQFSSIGIHMSGSRSAIVIENEEASSPGFSPPAIQLVKLGEVVSGKQHKASLCWAPGGKLALTGSITSEAEEQLEITSVTLNLKTGDWDIRLSMPLKQLLVWETGAKVISPVHGLPSTVAFARKPLAVKLEVAHDASAYVGEPLPIRISITNDDTRSVKLEMAAVLQPGPESDASDLSLQDGSSKSEQLDGIDLGSLDPGQRATKTLVLSPAVMATKIVEISLVARPIEADSGQGETDTLAEQLSKTVAIPVLDPFAIASTVRYLPSVHISNEEGKDGLTGEAVISSVITSPGPKTLTVESIEVVEATGSCALVSSSLAAGAVAPQGQATAALPGMRLARTEWDQASAFGFLAKFTVAPPRRASLAGVSSSPSASILLKWRSSSAFQSAITQTMLALPPLALPTRDSFLTATIDMPPTGQLHCPLFLTLAVLNTHPTSPAIDLSLQVDTADAFVWTGNRFAALPPIQPGEQMRVGFEVVPVGGTGWHALPAIRVWDGHGDDREEVVLASASGPIADGKRTMIYVRP